MKAITLAIVAFSALPISALSSQYTCLGIAANAVQIEASSLAEAEYKAKKIEDSQPKKFAGGVRCAAPTSDDIFVRDIRFKHNMQLRPYLPSDLRATGKIIKCDATGGFLPDGENNAGVCEEYSSASTNATWKVRAPYCHGTTGCSSGIGSAGMITKIWKRRGSAWVEWVEWEWRNGSLKFASNEARQYASVNGSNPDAGGNSGSPPLNPLPAGNPVNDIVNKGVTEFLKGLGK